jgi:hypothetical protein
MDGCASNLRAQNLLHWTRKEHLMSTVRQDLCAGTDVAKV